MKLVFIEGPGKKQTIEKYLGKEYVVFPTKGHIRDLPAKSFAIDFENNFEPTYEIIPEKKALVEEMKNKAKKAVLSSSSNAIGSYSKLNSSTSITEPSPPVK